MSDADREELMRERLHRLADDVDPRPDALPTLLAATRRRHRRRHVPLLVAVTAAAAVAVLSAVVLVVPGRNAAEPVSVGPDSYLAQPRPGVVAEFDLGSGAHDRRLAEVPAATGALAADGERVYAGTADGIVQLAPDGTGRALPGTDDVPERISAAGGRVAFPTAGAVAVLHGGARTSVPLPPGLRVQDLALAPDGALAVLAAAPGESAARLYVLPAGAHDWRPLPDPSGCGPVAVSFSGADVAALQPVSCTDPRLRVTTLRAEDGRIVGGGAVLPAERPLEPGEAGLSTDALGRHLVSVPGGGQWLVDGAEVRDVPWPCTREGECAPDPGVLRS
ncbi:hypothetical protein IQ251_09165 [Saccharopolyspora sp. HNM0983]|uniref:FbpC C-terminal regulatory nucleotide binding domain-containing protein n=1 Tax=Saccharopolyspora montiporae TaxID=2781240 RepID=A0A929FXF2_9PSEU|nr:hypothetical protein [Saccharopolyspora sp. HNM0983]MBE9374616.1 hypothetical protein [Saccharopolyspora sp. HNM0983]